MSVRLTDGMRVYYASEMKGPPDDDGWPTTVPDTTDKSDTGTVKHDGHDYRGTPILTVFWDNSEDPTSPECDGVAEDGTLATINGWALPLAAEVGT